MRRARFGWLLLVFAVAVAASAGDEEQQKVAKQPVDLHAAQALNTAEDPKQLESLLHWAIEHSDPQKLRQMAAGSSSSGGAEGEGSEDAAADLEARRQRVRELSAIMDAAQPSETQLLKTYIGLLGDSGSTSEQRLGALGRLAELVEPIDNANDLPVLGGLPPLLDALASPDPGLAEGAAAVLGTAASNNAAFQQKLLAADPGVVEHLLKLASSKDPAAAGAANKAMYALSALVRLSAAAQDSFLSHGGLKALAQLMGHPSVPTKVKDRAMNLMTDLADLAAAEQEEEEGQGGAGEQQHGGLQAAKWDTQLLTDFASAVLQLLQVGADDWDRKEKALLALRSLPQRHGAAGTAALVEAGAESTLREVLTELELLGPEIQDEEQLRHEDAVHAAESQEEQEEGRGAPNAYLNYIIALCADLLHSLSLVHTEL